MAMTDKPSLRLVGGHPALDLVNTVEPRVPGGVPEKEHLGSPGELLAWAVQAEVVDAAEARAVQRSWGPAAAGQGAQALHAVLTVREALYAVLMSRLFAGSAAAVGSAAVGSAAVGSAFVDSAVALEQLTLRWSAAAGRASLVLDEGGDAVARLAVGGVPAFAVQDRLAHAAVEFLRTLHLRDLRVCPLADGGCGWLFLDRSRNHSRRWCAMADCGARVKARRLTSRRRAFTRATG